MFHWNEVALLYFWPHPQGHLFEAMGISYNGVLVTGQFNFFSKEFKCMRLNLICKLGNFESIFVVCPCEKEFLTQEQFKNRS